MNQLRSERDAPFENVLRPRTLAEYVGQERAKKILGTALAAARSRKDTLDHILLHGGPGLGKTTLAMIIARELNIRIHVTTGAALTRGADVLSQLNELKEREVLFVDEVHRLKKPVEELLYSALEDFRLDVAVGKGASARMLRLPVEKFTMVGATTRLGVLSAPFRNRFGLIIRLEPYTVPELRTIVTASAVRLKCDLEPGAAVEIAGRSRGTPRISNHLLKRSRDWAQANEGGKVTTEVVRHALEDLGIDADGLDEMDRKIMGLLVNRYGGGPVGLKTLAIASGEDPETVEDFYEPYLIEAGFMMRTAQGRKATVTARDRFSRKDPDR
jgi:Holliday junction DNA helicase RuvB